MSESSVNGRFGLWIQVPEGNGYTSTSFNDRVRPHIQDSIKGVSVFVPAFALLQIVRVEEDRKIDEEPIPADERQFGVALDIRGEWWNEVNQRLGLVMQTMIQHYGLEVILTACRCKPDGVTRIFLKEIESQDVDE